MRTSTKKTGIGLCHFCKESIGSFELNCPHCGRPSLFPNITQAKEQGEVRALRKRYKEQLKLAETQGRGSLLKDLEECARSSLACKAMQHHELERLATSDSATCATYYMQLEGEVRLPGEDKWERLRRISDAAFFQSLGKKIHFGALSTDGKWLPHYGPAVVFFKENMIAHRATVFEMNTAKWVEVTNGNLTIPKGSRATWDNRHLLAVAKLGTRMVAGEAAANLILKPGTKNDGEDDDFIEVHILGKFTIRSACEVKIKSGHLSDLSKLVVREKLEGRAILFKEIEND